MSSQHGTTHKNYENKSRQKTFNKNKLRLNDYYDIQPEQVQQQRS